MLLRGSRLLWEWEAELHVRSDLASCERLRGDTGSNQVEKPPVSSFGAPSTCVISSAARNPSYEGKGFSVAVARLVRALLGGNDKSAAFLAAVEIFQRASELDDADVIMKRIFGLVERDSWETR